MKQLIDIATWKRKEHFQFFKDYQEPFFGVTANVDCTKAYSYAKANKLSFFLYYMYQSLAAVNAIEEFRYRIENGKVVCFDTIHCSTTALNANNLFAFLCCIVGISSFRKTVFFLYILPLHIFFIPG